MSGADRPALLEALEEELSGHIQHGMPLLSGLAKAVCEGHPVKQALTVVTYSSRYSGRAAQLLRVLLGRR